MTGSDVTSPLARLFGALIVSCQASEGDSFRQPESMARFAQDAVRAGAAGIRANGAEDVRAIRQAVRVPVIGIEKKVAEDGQVLITGSFEEAKSLVEAGAEIIALDCTRRGRQFGALDRLRRVRRELGVAVMADIATVDEAVAAAEAGADVVASTLRGYTADTEGIDRFEPDFIEQLVRRLSLPVFAEGRIHTPAEASMALDAGAQAVIVGTAITRPRHIAEWFVRAVARAVERRRGVLIAGIDLGGTNTKYGVVDSRGQLLLSGVAPTPAKAGREALLDHLARVARTCVDEARASGLEPRLLGIATAGWVDPHTGRVAYSTDNLPGWTGAPIAEVVGRAAGLPAAVENDANAWAMAERHFGEGRGVDDFVCITLGTGVGGGCYAGGRLNRGSHFFANAIGHISVVPRGQLCTCGLKGCLEAYANATALMRYAAGHGFDNAKAVIEAANAGHAGAREAVRTLAGYLASGAAIVIHLLDPRLLIISGGLTENNPLLLADFEAALREQMTVWEERGLRFRYSRLGYSGGVLGAAAAAIEKYLE